MRILIRVPSGAAETVELAPNESVLIGRQPDATRAPGMGTSHTLTVPSPSISANHVLITQLADGTRVCDLESRNGSWLQLPPGVPVSLPPVETLGLQLAPSSSGRALHELPVDARWATREDFRAAILRSIDEWLQQRRTPARVEIVVAQSEPREDLPGRIPLTDGYDLLVEAQDTMDPEWLEVLACIDGYVARQREFLLAEDELGEAGLVVASPAMKDTVRKVIGAAQRGARSLLLIGPSGSGKEGLARCFHRHTRRDGAFVSRNCAAFNFGKDLIVSELFGAEKGAFTGCLRPIVGAVEAAHDGTLFLDEIAELPLDVQSTLLRFLDRGEYSRLGGKRAQRADVRVVGATNQDLRAACLAGQFRRDLWFRLSIQVVEVPSLSRRPEDVLAYLRARPRDDGRSLLEALEPAAVALLQQHRWEGNFRELINFADRLPHSGSIGLEVCRRALAEGALHHLPSSAPPSASPTPAGEVDWPALSGRAVTAFIEDHAAPPRSWDDVKDLVERYLKPLLFATLAGVSGAGSRDTVDLRTAAEELRADRGTAAKQLDRFFARFGADTQ